MLSILELAYVASSVKRQGVMKITRRIKYTGCNFRKLTQTQNGQFCVRKLLQNGGDIYRTSKNKQHMVSCITRICDNHIKNNF